MRRRTPVEIREFLRAIDRELPAEVVAVVIGGAAVALGHDSRHATADVDLWQNPGEQFWEAVRRVRDPIPVEVAAIASPPHDFEDRLIRVSGLDAPRLTVLVPERHDLALLKVSRGQPHDFDAIESVHGRTPLSLETLIGRYEETLTQVIGPERRFRLNFLALVARLFGEGEAERIEPSLPWSWTERPGN